MHEPSRSHRPKSIPRRGQWYFISNIKRPTAMGWLLSNSVSYSVLAIKPRRNTPQG